MIRLAAGLLIFIYSMMLNEPLFASSIDELRNAIVINNISEAKTASKIAVSEFRDSRVKDVEVAMLLLSAFQNRRYEIAEIMLQDGFNASAINRSGNPVLFEMSMLPEAEPLEILLGHGVKIDAVDKMFKKTALHSAVILGHLHHVYTLVKAGAALDIIDGSGETVLSYLVRFAHRNELKYVLDSGADVDILVGRHRTQTALSIAVASGQRAIVDLLLAYNADPNLGNINWRPVDIALSSGHVEFVEKLVAAGGRIDALTKDGYTFLVTAALLGQHRKVDVLVAQGANVNLSNSNGFTPLIVAAQQGYLQICKILLSNGANRYIKNKEGKTALDLAQVNYHFEVIKLLSY